jgi:hypothetical protein
VSKTKKSRRKSDDYVQGWMKRKKKEGLSPPLILSRYAKREIIERG